MIGTASMPARTRIAGSGLIMFAPVRSRRPNLAPILQTKDDGFPDRMYRRKNPDGRRDGSVPEFAAFPTRGQCASAGVADVSQESAMTRIARRTVLFMSLLACLCAVLPMSAPAQSPRPEWIDALRQG